MATDNEQNTTNPTGTRMVFGVDARDARRHIDKAIVALDDFHRQTVARYRAALAIGLRIYDPQHPRTQAAAWLLLATNYDDAEPGVRPDCLEIIVGRWVQDLYESGQRATADALAWALGEVGR